MILDIFLPNSFLGDLMNFSGNLKFYLNLVDFKQNNVYFVFRVEVTCEEGFIMKRKSKGHDEVLFF